MIIRVNEFVVNGPWKWTMVMLLYDFVRENLLDQRQLKRNYADRMHMPDEPVRVPRRICCKPPERAALLVHDAGGSALSPANGKSVGYFAFVAEVPLETLLDTAKVRTPAKCATRGWRNTVTIADHNYA